VQAREALQVAGRRGDIEALVKALATMGARLAEIYPVEDDDIDELPNEVAA
jgi:uncharacterized membrane protein